MLVPDYEAYKARVDCHYTEQEWDAIGPRGRARAVAYLRIRNMVDLHTNAVLQDRIKKGKR